MELWIRSQDKEAITKVNMGVMYWKDIDNRNCIVNKDNATGYSILGAYKSKERALEVLDEIQNILCPKKPKSIIGKNVEFIPSIVYVYEMPKE